MAAKLRGMDMTPLDPTRTERTPGGTIIAAWSADGRWSYERLDEPGHPWLAYDERADRELDWFRSLAKARRATYQETAGQTGSTSTPASEMSDLTESVRITVVDKPRHLQ